MIIKFHRFIIYFHETYICEAELITMKKLIEMVLLCFSYALSCFVLYLGYLLAFIVSYAVTIKYLQ